MWRVFGSRSTAKQCPVLRADSAQRLGSLEGILRLIPDEFTRSHPEQEN